MDSLLNGEDSAEKKELASGIFAIRGDLDGSKLQSDFSEVKQFIGLLVGDEEFLLPIEFMNEIIMLNQLTYVPGSPPFVEGVINLRGTISPAINLRRMMGLPSSEPTNQTRIIIAHYDDYKVGLIVDGITYVVSLYPNQLENKSLSSNSGGAELIMGISKRGDQVNGILDITRVLSECGAKIGGGTAAED